MLALRRAGAEARRRSGAALLSTLPRFDYKVENLYDTNYLDVPRLPLPQLEDTLKRYLETVRPHASEEDFAAFAEKVNEFEKTVGPAAHAAVQAGWEGPGYPYSYVERFWDDMYQAGRWEVMVNSNPFYFFPDETNPAEQEQTRRAAKLASACVRWWQKVTGGTLEADMERGKPLCMHGYGLVFGATRVPGVGRDSLETKFHERKHIVVLCNHLAFRVPVIGADGLAIGADELQAQLDAIRERALAQPGDVSKDVGPLTAQERDTWARLRAELAAAPGSKDALAAMDDCLFVVALDQTEAQSPAEVSQTMLTGNNGTNRWFDKHNIIATKDGSLGMNFDHTFGDGLTWNRMLQEAWSDMHGTASGFEPLPAPATRFGGSFEPLQWDLPPAVASEMGPALERASKLAGDVDTAVLEFDDFGRNRMKEMGMSPDAVCQMAFQLAYWNMHGKAPPVYESCAMKNFFHGRTETIRSCTNESVAMARAFLDDASDDTKRANLLEAARVHVEVAKGAKSASGPYLGVDRHLYAMKNVAAEQGLDTMGFFADPLHDRAGTWALSTSNVSAPFIRLFGFGAVCGHGYGLGYMTQPDHVPVNITSYFSNPDTDSTRMAGAIADSLRTFDRLFPSNK